MNPAYAVMIDKLSMLDLEEHIGTIIMQIVRPTENVAIELWTVDEVYNWVRKIDIGDEALMQRVAEILRDECVDGYTLMVVTEKEWTEHLCLDHRILQVIKIILQGWCLDADGLLSLREAIGDGLNSGIITNLSNCPTFIAQRMAQVDSDCSLCGVGGIYGQITVVGCKELQEKKNDITPLGVTNLSYVLKRRKVANGTTEGTMPIVHVATEQALPQTSDKCVTIALPSDSLQCAAKANGPVLLDTMRDGDRRIAVLKHQNNPLRDVFQVGRAMAGGNDFTVPGVLHVDDEGCTAGPVSRYACRIECERLPPFRVFIYAGGFDPITQRIDAKHHYIPTSSEGEGEIDGFTTFGVRILQPELGEWLEISVRGNTYVPRRLPSEAPQLPVEAPLGNQLTDGTVIDLGGVCLLYRSPIAMARAPQTDPQMVVQLLNSLKPHCPVLFNDITFAFTDNQERLQRARHRAFEASALCDFAAGVQVPWADYSHLPEENRPYVFPACGHIFAYHSSIEGRPCPLCRQEGSFVPIAFSFEPAICDKFPTHVFNPCGHIAPQEVCAWWADAWIPSHDVAAAEQVHLCPYCATELVPTSTEQPYSRLCLQSETGQTWPDPGSSTSAVRAPAHALAAAGTELEGDFAALAGQYATEYEDTSLVEVIRSQQLLFLREHSSAGETFETGRGQAVRGGRIKPRAFPKYAPQLL